MNCPICGRFSPDGSPRCTACGADFRDPDVMALARAPARPLTAAPEVEVAGLAQDRLLLMTGAGIRDGSSLRRLAAIGAGFVLLGALIPLRFDDEMRFPLTATDVGPTFALLAPVLLAAVAFGLALVRAVPVVVAGAILALAGAIELGFGIAPLGDVAFTSTELPVATLLGLAVGATGVCLRVLRPTDPIAPWLVVAGAVLYIGGALLPHEAIDDLLPFELHEGGDGSILGVASDAAQADLAHAVLGVILLAPAALLPIAALLAFRQPRDLWDPSGNPLRVIGTVLVLGPGLFFLALALDADYAPAGVFPARCHLGLLATGAMLWLASGACGVAVARGARTRGAPSPGSDSPRR